MAAPFTIDGSIEADTARVRLRGELDLAAKPALRTCVGDFLTNDAVATVLIDLTELTFVDSSGISALVACLRLASGAGKTLRAVGAQGRVAYVLDLTGVWPLLTGA